MGLVDILIVIGVFAFFGYIILAKMKEKNPKRHSALVGMLKSTGKVKEKFKKEKPEVTPVILPDSARIM